MFLAARVLERGEYAESLRLLERAITTDPQLPLAYQNLGIVLHISGNPERALTAFDRALALKPVAPLTRLHRGTILEELGRRDEALLCYRIGLNALPRRARELVNDPATPGKPRELIGHGMRFAHDRFETIVAAHLAPVAARYGDTALVRVHAAVGCRCHRFSNTHRSPVFTAGSKRAHPTALWARKLQARNAFTLDRPTGLRYPRGSRDP